MTAHTHTRLDEGSPSCKVEWLGERVNRPGAEEQVSQVEEAGPVLHVEDGRLQKAVELLVEVGVIPARTHAHTHTLS